jgi:hypothetical protein
MTANQTRYVVAAPDPTIINDLAPWAERLEGTLATAHGN